MSARPPVFEYGWTSLAARRIFMLQTPNTKHQPPNKSQVPNTKPPPTFRDYEAWCFEVFWCLVFGVWCFSRRDSLRLQIRLQRFGNFHAPIRLLIRLDQRHEQPRQRRPAAVENMWE